jgi:archaemetzincin
MERITLVPIGAIEPEILVQLKQSLEQTYASMVEIGPQRVKPDYAYNPRRGQYLASLILNAINEFAAEGKMLGVVDIDLYAPGLNFIFGQADIKRGIAVISLCRLRQEYYGLAQDKGLFSLRAMKEAIHEIGHTHGLMHCPDEGCVMHFSNSLADTDRKEDSLCQKCRSKLWSAP